MKPIFARTIAVIAITASAAACIPAPDSTPAPEQEPVIVTPIPTPTPTLAPAPSNWLDAPRTPGDWSYRSEAGGSIALYGATQSEALFSMRCDRANRSITLMRTSPGNGPIRIRTETSERVVNATRVSGRTPAVAATLPASDPLLAAIAYTRGRFAVETPGTNAIYLPPWAEAIRVIEDCR